MQRRKLGTTDLELTAVGLGTWAIGGPWQYGWGPQDDRDSLDAIYEAIDCGINWIDTAPIYGCGHSEIIVGKALKDMSQKPIVATKCGLLWNDQREKLNNLKKDSIVRECHDSLRRLGIETIDLYQIHWPIPDGDLEAAWEAIDQLIGQGKVRYGGVCNFQPDQMDRLMPIRKPASLQPPYSMLARGIENEHLGYCARHQIGVVCYSPMHKGLLTGKFSHEYLKQMPDNDHRKQLDRDFKEPRFSRNLEIVEQLKKIAAEYSRPVAQIAIAWTLRRPEVTSAIVGARKKGQISQTAPAGDLVLSAMTVEQIEAILS